MALLCLIRVYHLKFPILQLVSVCVWCLVFTHFNERAEGENEKPKLSKIGITNYDENIIYLASCNANAS